MKQNRAWARQAGSLELQYLLYPLYLLYLLYLLYRLYLQNLVDLLDQTYLMFARSLIQIATNAAVTHRVV